MRPVVAAAAGSEPASFQASVASRALSFDWRALEGGADALHLVVSGSVFLRTPETLLELPAGTVLVGGWSGKTAVRAVERSAVLCSVQVSRPRLMRFLPDWRPHRGDLFLPLIHAADQEFALATAAFVAACRSEQLATRVPATRLVDRLWSCERALEPMVARCLGRTLARRLDSYLRLARARCVLSLSVDLIDELDTIAGIARFSKHHFVRQFTSVFGVQPMRFQNQQRLERALQRLQSSGEAVREIADWFGYASATSFSRQVRSRYGLPPSRLRQGVATATPAAEDSADAGELPPDLLPA